MIHFPATPASRTVEDSVTKGLIDFVPKNEKKAIDKVVELIGSARTALVKNGDLQELEKTYQEVKLVEDPANPDWLGFSYYYHCDEKLFVGLLQVDKRWWEKTE